MAPNDAETYRHICSFFADSELGCAPPESHRLNQLNGRLVSAIDEPSPLQPAVNASLGLVKSMQLGPQPFTACCLVKPDGVPHLPEILLFLHQVELFVVLAPIHAAQERFELVGARMLTVTREQCMQLLASGGDWGATTLQAEHVAHVTSGPCVVLAVRRTHALAALLRVAGPVPCRSDAPIDTIRAALACRTHITSAVHGATPNHRSRLLIRLQLRRRTMPPLPSWRCSSQTVCVGSPCRCLLSRRCHTKYMTGVLCIALSVTGLAVCGRCAASREPCAARGAGTPSWAAGKQRGCGACAGGGGGRCALGGGVAMHA